MSGILGIAPGSDMLITFVMETSAVPAFQSMFPILSAKMVAGAVSESYGAKKCLVSTRGNNCMEGHAAIWIFWVFGKVNSDNLVAFGVYQIENGPHHVGVYAECLVGCF